jgi:hypothetical protein
VLRTIELWGTAAERGRRHGQTLAAEIRQMRRAILRYLARLSFYAGAMPAFGVLQVLARRFWPFIPFHLKEEMIAAAKGAQVGLGTLLLINVADDLANNTPRCSALAVGEGLTDGPYLMGRNLDYPVFTEPLSRLQTLFVMEGAGGQALASLAWPGFVGVCTGINRAGVALAQLSSMSRDRTLKGIPAAMRFRQALEAGRTVPEVAAQVMNLPGTIGNNLMLCGPGEAMVVELSARWVAVRRPQEGLLTATNHYQSPAMHALKGRFPPRPPFSVLSSYHFTEAYSQARDQRLRQLAAGQKLGPMELRTILADAKIANLGTALCAIFSPSDRTLWVAQGSEPPVNQGPFAEITLWQ